MREEDLKLDIFELKQRAVKCERRAKGLASTTDPELIKMRELAAQRGRDYREALAYKKGTKK